MCCLGTDFRKCPVNSGAAGWTRKPGSPLPSPVVSCAGRAARASEEAYRPESAMPIMREGDHRRTPIPCGEVPIQGF